MDPMVHFRTKKPKALGVIAPLSDHLPLNQAELSQRERERTFKERE